MRPQLFTAEYAGLGELLQLGYLASMRPQLFTAEYCTQLRSTSGLFSLQ